jgi:mRNA-degrading endonuclease RelE of RelBE toxin-antitoxin system
MANQRVFWSDEARADLRAIEQDTALRLLKSLDRHVKTGAGNFKQLEGYDPPLFRLRIGAWRIVYRHRGEEAIEVVRVRNRREAYRNLAT